MEYLNKWESLQMSQQAIVDEFVRIYEKHGIGIAEYTTFKEYKREKFLLDCYVSVIAKINGD